VREPGHHLPLEGVILLQAPMRSSHNELMVVIAPGVWQSCFSHPHHSHSFR
jgi:hypothetical protein